MSAIITAFGIDWRLLAIDTVNFGLVFFALWYFLYDPLVRMLEKRRQIVAQGVIDAELAEKRLAEIETERGEVLAAAGRSADEVLSRARKAAADKERELAAQSESAAARVIAEAEAEGRELKRRAEAESREDIAKLIVLGIEKAAVSKR